MKIRTDVGEFDKFIKLLPQNIDPHLIPVTPTKSPDVPQGENAKDEKYRLTVAEARERLQRGENVAMYLRDDFAVLDVDDPERALDFLDDDITKRTLTVSSRSGKPHLWFLRGEGIEGRDIPNIIELRTGWRYVLIPGSHAYDKKEFEETGEKKWGSYTVGNPNKTAKLRPGDLPEELQPKVLEDVDIDISEDIEKVEFVNEYGWKIEDVRERDKKLDALLTDLNPSEYDYSSRSEADLATMNRLLYWEFDDGTICTILREFRSYEKTERGDYLERTLRRAKGGIERTISQDEDPVCWNPVDGLLYHEKGAFRPKLLAEAIMDDFDFITPEDTEEPHVYREGVFRPVGETLIRSETQKRLGRYSKRYYQNEVVNFIQSETYVPRDDLNKNPYEIVVKNGVLDLETLELTPHSANPPSTVKIPVEYNPDAKCPRIKKFLGEVLNDDDIPTIREGIGYCLVKNYPIASAFMLLGAGANGKSTLLSLIARFIGSENVATPSLQDLLVNRFAKAELYGKLANIHADLPTRKLEQTGTFKMLSGGDLIYGEKKFRSAFTFENHAKLWYSTNELPFTEDRSDAFFRRWILIDFPNTFSKDDPKTDPHLIDKITGEEELSGLLNWVLGGLHRLLERGHFEKSKSQKEVEMQWILQTDSIRAFVLKRCEKDVESVISKSDFYDAYLKFCDDLGVSAAAKNTVGRRLPSVAPYIRASHPMIEGRRVWCWRGVKLIRRVRNVQDSHNLSKQSELNKKNSKVNNDKNKDTLKIRTSRTRL